MRKNIGQVIEAFLCGESKNEKSCSTDGKVIYSYSMAIANRTGQHSFSVIDSSHSPSHTTTVQINSVRRYLCRDGEVEIVDKIRSLDK